MNPIKLLSFLLVGSILFVACNEDDDQADPCSSVTCEIGKTLTVLNSRCLCVADNEILVTENITSDAVWTADKIWVLTNRVSVTAGASLTIDPGTVVKGLDGSGANSTALLIARGAKIFAKGTADSPIIFTSYSDNIVPGEIVSPNLDININGLWGGVIVLGNAPISADNTSIQIEGIPADDFNGLYGGDNPMDDSGIIEYISIRHGGTNIGEGNEINGLTLGGVGTGTVVHHIEVVANKDDGIEMFGGTVDVSNCLVMHQGDDGFDTDQAWSGTFSNIIGVMGPDSDHALELDGPEGATNGAHTIIHGSFKGYFDAANPTVGGEYADLRSDAMVTLENLYFFNFFEDADLELDNNQVATNFMDGEIVFRNLYFNVGNLPNANAISITDIVIEKANSDAGEVKLGVFDNYDFAGNSVQVGTVNPAFGADKSAFVGWTLADRLDILSDF